MLLPYNEPSFDALAAINERLSESVRSVKTPFLREAVVHVLQGGKRIRPLLCMLACSAAGGNPRQSVDAAVAIELLHTASLVHDDLMDESPLRRGVPTLHTLYDVPTAILSGDALIALAFEQVRKVRVPMRERIQQTFSIAFRELCEGQALDLQHVDGEQTPQAIPDQVARKKTASLTRVACEMGALHAVTEESTVHALKMFGYFIGMAFQAQDDLLDVVGTESELGKPTLLDLKNGKITFATRSEPGDCEPAKRVVQDYTDAALRALERIPRSAARDQLANLAHALTERRM